MSTIFSMNAKVQKLNTFHNEHDLAIYLTDYPEVLLSKYGYQETLRVLTRIMNEHKEHRINFLLISTIIETCIIKSLDGYRPETIKEASEGGTIRGLVHNDWATTLLQIYLKLLSEQENPFCDVVNEYNGWPSHPKQVDVWGYLGFMILAISYFNVNSTYTMMEGLFFTHQERLESFLRVFADITTPLTDRDASCAKLAYIWASHIREERDGEYTQDIDQQNLFVRKCTDGDLDWLYEKLNQEDRTGKNVSSEMMEEICDLYINLSNVFSNDFGRVNYLYEYLAQTCIFYPLEARRVDTINRYTRYFGDLTPIFAIDFMSEVIHQFGILYNYRGNDVKNAENTCKRLAENQLIKLRQAFPTVDKQVVRCFYNDLCRCYARGFNGAAPGLMLDIESMIDTIWSEPAIDSYLDTLDMEMAIEGSYGDDGDVSKPEKTSSSSNRVEGRDMAKTITTKSNLHRRAHDDESKMQAGERKIYNAYKKYKNAEDKVDTALANGLKTIKRAITGDQQKIIIEGKPFSPIGFLKKVIVTVGIFNYSKIAGILALIVSHTLKKKANDSEKKQLLRELEQELVMVNEKLEDARGDGNREAKYDLMRTKMAYEEAIKRIKFGIGAQGRKTAILKSSQKRVNQTSNRPGYVG